jgi:hypothetical protein
MIEKMVCRKIRRDKFGMAEKKLAKKNLAKKKLAKKIWRDEFGKKKFGEKNWEKKVGEKKLAKKRLLVYVNNVHNHWLSRKTPILKLKTGENRPVVLSNYSEQRMYIHRT